MNGKEGFWSVAYQNELGFSGFGLIALDTGRIVGVDVAGGLWDGTYRANGRTSEFELELTVEFPPAVVSTVTGRASARGHAETYRFGLPNDLGRAVPFQLDILGQPMTVLFKKVRDFPQ